MTKRIVLLVAALTLLNLSLTFRNLWPTPLVTWKGELSVELAGVAFLLTLIPRKNAAPRALVRTITIVWVALFLARYVDVTAPALWGRDLNFYWDLRFLPDVVAMLAGPGHWWRGPLAVAAIVLLFSLLYVLLRWAVTALLTTTAHRPGRTIARAISALLLVLFMCERTDLLHVPGVTFARPAAALYVEQARLISNGFRHTRELPPSPSFDADLEEVQGADVLLFFIESYGAITFDRPAFSNPLTASRQALEQAIAESGQQVVSALVTSPTFGGSSWFAHVTLLSGISVGDPDTNADLLRQQRETLPTVFSRHGYRTLAVMPGMWSPWPEGRFYGFSDIYNAPRLDYHGPPFGWWDLTDEFAYAKLDEVELDKKNRPPAFVFLPTISTHTPFTPTPPYQPDWSRLTGDAPYDPADLDRAYAQEIDWTDLTPSYVRAIAYSYDTLAGYVRKHQHGDFVMILIGDHQPPALVTGTGASWNVPIHIITTRQPILDRLKAKGFVSGLTPPRQPLGPMNSVTETLLAAFGTYRPAP